MLKIGVVTIICAGIYVSIMAFSKNEVDSYMNFEVSSIQVEHGCLGIVDSQDEYQMLLSFKQELTEPVSKELNLKAQGLKFKCINPITDIQIFSTEKVTEQYPAGKDITSLFTFHYVKIKEKKYGTMIKEGMVIPLNEFENLVDQDIESSQLRILKLSMHPHPIQNSDHQFIVKVFFSDGQIQSDTTECISFAGINN